MWTVQNFQVGKELFINNSVFLLAWVNVRRCYTCISTWQPAAFIIFILFSLFILKCESRVLTLEDPESARAPAAADLPHRQRDTSLFKASSVSLYTPTLMHFFSLQGRPVAFIWLEGKPTETVQGWPPNLEACLCIAAHVITWRPGLNTKHL